MRILSVIVVGFLCAIVASMLPLNTWFWAYCLGILSAGFSALLLLVERGK